MPSAQLFLKLFVQVSHRRRVKNVLKLGDFGEDLMIQHFATQLDVEIT